VAALLGVTTRLVFQSQAEASLQSTAGLLLSSLDWAVAPLLSNDDPEAIQRLFENFAGDRSVRMLRLIGREGNILAEAHMVGQETLPTPFSIEEIFARGKFILEAFTEDVYYAAVPVRGQNYDRRHGSDVEAVLILGMSTETLIKNFSPFSDALTAISILAILILGAILLGALQHFFFRPLAAIKSATARLKDGDYSAQVRLHSSREFEEFAELFNRMAGEIAGTMERNRKITDELRESSLRLEYAQEAAGEGIWDWDTGSGRVQHNAQWCKLLGLDESFLEHPLEAFAERIHGEDRSRVFARIDAAMKCSQPYESQHRMVHPDGGILWVNDRGRVVERDGEGRPQRMVGSMADITAWKTASEALYRTNIALISANEVKSDFLANMSHEIRTPMNGVLGVAHLLLDTDLDEGQRSYAEILLSSSEALLVIVNDILDFSKIEAGKLDLKSLDFNLRSLLDELVMLMTRRAQAKGLQLRCTIDPDVPGLLRSDPGRLRQILNNLLDNALKFTQKGEVAIHVSRGEASTLRFSVRDTGIGIDPEKLGQLFSKFTQADASSTRQFGGIGLGLAISKQLAELLGGEVGVESSLGQGSEFWFTLRMEVQAEGPPEASPLSVEDAESGPTEAVVATHSTGQAGQPAPPPSSPARILLVEDNLTNQVIAQAMLNNLGVHADTASDGQKALTALEHKRYDLVLMDLHMPGMDGLEATRRIRDPLSAVLDHSIPIVAMTASAMKGDCDRCLDAGMNDYVSKPISPEALKVLVLRWLLKPGDRQEQKPEDRQEPKPAGGKGARGEEGALGKEAMPPDPAGHKALVVFDRNDMAQRFQHDVNLIKYLLSHFLEDILVHIKNLFDSMETGDLPAAELRAHTIKGAAANIGAMALRAVAEKLESCAKEGDLPAMQTQRGELELQCERLREQLKQELAAPSG
jgi:PAS domain S-box-containing protein